MSITVAIVTKDRVGSLKRCLDSLISQTEKPYEVLVIDSSKNNSTKLLVDSYKKKIPIRYIFEKRIGIAIARNRALEIAKGQFLAFLDDDCSARTDWIKNLDKEHKANPYVFSIQGWSKNIPEYTYQSIISQFNLDYGLNRYKTADKNKWKISIIDTRNVSFNKEQLIKHNIKFNTKLQGFDEIEIAKRILFKGGEIVFNKKVQVYHYERETLGKFFIKRFKMGFWRRRMYKNWKRYEPSWGLGIYAGRVFSFLRFSYRYKNKTNVFVLTVLFFIENILFLFGTISERFIPSYLTFPNNSSFPFPVKAN